MSVESGGTHVAPNFGRERATRVVIAGYKPSRAVSHDATGEGHGDETTTTTGHRRGGSCA
jgi:hypothetical protein